MATETMVVRLFLCLCVWFLLTIHCTGVGHGSSSVAGFVSLDVLKRDAYQLYPVRSPTQPRQRLFPHLSFNCPANVTKLVFLAVWEEWQEGGRYPEFQIWSPAGQNTSEYSKVASVSADHEAAVCINGLCELVLEEQMAVSPGDIFGLHQPHKDMNLIEVMYQDGGGGAIHYRSRSDEPLSVFDFTSSDVTHSTDHTMVSIETDPPGCSAGFLDDTALRMYTTLMQLRSHSGEQHIFPEIHFTCSGTITKWLVGGHKREPISTDATTLEDPKFQLWRESGGIYERSDITDNSITTFQLTNDPNLYEYVPSPALPFSPGDILGVYQPAMEESHVTLQYQRRTGDRSYAIAVGDPLATFSDSGVSPNYDRPFIGVEIAGGTEPCTTGFLSTEDLRTRAAEIVVLRTHAGQQRLFPSIQFTTEGALGAWTIAAEYNQEGASLPELQIWRQVSETNYTLLTSSGTRELQPRPTGYLNVYEIELDPAMQFRPGDFIGIFQPQERNLLTLVSSEGAGGSSYHVHTTHPLQRVSNLTELPSNTDFPLMTVRVLSTNMEPQENSTVTQSPSPTSTPRPPTTPPGTTATSEAPSTSSKTQNRLILAAVGASAGLLLGILGTTLIMIGLVCVCVHAGRNNRRRRKVQPNGGIRIEEEEDGHMDVEASKSRYSALPEGSSSIGRGGPSRMEEEDDEHLYDRPTSVIRTMIIREPLPPIPIPKGYDQPRVPSEMSSGTPITPLSSPPSVTRVESVRMRENVAYSTASELDLGAMQTDGETADDTSDYTSDSMQYSAAYGKPLPITLYSQPYAPDDLSRSYGNPVPPGYSHPRT